MRARFVMIITPGQGERLKRKGLWLRRTRPDGLADRLIVIRSPARLARLAFLSRDRAREPADQWVYLPRFRRARRVKAHAVHDGYVGSDFTYSDFGRVRIEAGRHRLEGKSDVGGRPCFVVRTTTSDPNLPYTELLSKIDAETWLPLVREYYDGQGQLSRVGTLHDIVAIEGFPTARTLSMVDKLSGSRSEIRLEVHYDVGLEPEIFTVDHLESDFDP